MTATDRKTFIFAFFPFLNGIYPYSAVTEKQLEAIDAVGEICDGSLRSDTNYIDIYRIHIIQEV